MNKTNLNYYTYTIRVTSSPESAMKLAKEALSGYPDSWVDVVQALDSWQYFRNAVGDDFSHEVHNYITEIINTYGRDPRNSPFDWRDTGDEQEPCQHKFVNVGFMSVKYVCENCDEEKK